MVNLSELKPRSGARHKPKRVGRGIGSGHGKTACRGYKGQNSRSGRDKHTVGFEGGQMPLSRRIPKRGFKNPFRKQYAEVNLDMLKKFKAGSVVSRQELVEAGLVKKGFPVKILGRGELDKPLFIRADLFSAGAKAKIESAGGKAEVSE
jgi:large subunit ribosomal protein L15